MRTTAVDLLKSAYDLHVHCSPDVVERRLTDDEMAARVIALDMRGFAIKSHYAPTADRAASIRHRYPEVNAIGSLTLNTSVGGINPMAVETAARLGAKMVWFPTMDSYFQNYLLEHLPHHVDMQVQLRKRGIPVAPVRILGENDQLIENARQVIELAVFHDLVVGTGHISHEETFALVKAAQEARLAKLVITHVDWEGTRYSIEDQQRLVAMGAMIEHCFSDSIDGLITVEETFEQVRRVGVEHILLSSDLGKTSGMYPDEGLVQFVEKFLQAGFTEEEIREMLVNNPARLIEE